jgi:putative sugar O-methyltransferase
MRGRINRVISKFGVASTERARGGQSVSGRNHRYLKVCQLAAHNPEVLSTFRRNPDYTAILEHVNEEQGREYLRLARDAGLSNEQLEDGARNDRIGDPATIAIGNMQISPTTLRYLKVATDISHSFGTLDGARVAEIGVGYGGQCRILDGRQRLESYTLIDMKPVLGLAEAYLSHFALRCAVRFKTMNELAVEKFDLIISNYAVTELAREVQIRYFEKVIDGSSRGYVTYNDIAPPDFQSMTRQEICDRVGGRVTDERPLTHPLNCLIVWGDSFAQRLDEKA